MRQNTSDSQSSVRALSRGLTLLMHVLERPDGMSVAELSRETGLHKATVSRLLGSLASEGYLSIHPQTGHYMVGAKLASRVRVRPMETFLGIKSKPILASLRDACNETVALYIPVWPDRVVVAQEQSTLGLRRVYDIGETWSLTAGATGLAYMSTISEEELTALLKVRPLKSFTERSVTEEAVLRQRIAETRSRGYAIGVSDIVPGMSGLSTPVIQEGRPIAMITISGPRDRWTTDRMAILAPELVESSRRLSSLISYGV